MTTPLVRDVRRTAIVAAAAFALAFVPNARVQDAAFVFVLFAALGGAWNWIGGYAGRPSLGHALFFGIGAYAVALSNVRGGSPWYGALGGGIIAALVASIVGAPALRLRGIAFAAATAAVLAAARALVSDAPALRGSAGFLIPVKPGFLNLQFTPVWPYVLLAVVLFCAVQALTLTLERTSAGAFLRTIRIDERGARSLGIAPVRWTLLAFVASAFITSVCGSLFAQYALAAAPGTVFAFSLAGAIALIALVGGAATLWGPVLGALLYVAVRAVTGPVSPDADVLVFVGEALAAAAIVRTRWRGLVRSRA